MPVFSDYAQLARIAGLTRPYWQDSIFLWVVNSSGSTVTCSDSFVSQADPALLRDLCANI